MKKSLKTIIYNHHRGEIHESAIKALVTDPLFKSRVERNRKGKVGYERGESPFKNVLMSNFKWAFLLAFSK
ncbi:ribosome alternative rescue factor ArfA [Actinobacillus equuli subsp. equuli]|uniref:Ribosome alternative rescue factor ArfA n=1 Tax=Actinobacillus equuli subsp. equuli TaxID=202947 RepID=A0A9X4G5B9_ACTEU|nr:alternative ribosome rescue factor ArfA [Actinobacillus equuli]MDE8034669.1 ribosome alternative rescue factor ArfA [Actinobacillus equuli subsp. equuli]MDG4948693.1 ribosome alternative rescue factor ArfA [Actinobacillus equuli subsp. haemolyticus]